MEETIKILEEIRNGSKECLEIELRNNPNNNEDIKHYKDEMKAIEKIINSYNKEKARADKLEKEYSKLLTKIDEYEANLTDLDYFNKELED